MTTSPSLLDAALASRSRIAAAKRRALAVRKNASGPEGATFMPAGGVRCPQPPMLLRVRRSLGPRLHVRGATACSAQRTIRRFVRNEVVVGRLNDAKAQVLGQKESTIDALREAGPSASWRNVVCEHAVDSRCRITQSFDIVARVQARQPVPCVCNEQDDGAHPTAAPRRAEIAALSMPMVDGRRTC
ncbi:hypothetical protein MK974_26190 [Burkholderia ambifaria]|uniref:hypothetical protein n=1 Tax=Burkholderia ambifaria TaxID=152480 RepID=UPI0022A91381|nr:hypothetical protein [Burkholderia ambifaria]WAS56580.1 hypothetical protein MK974_26190 [Burkholderia ambifaria]